MTNLNCSIKIQTLGKRLVSKSRIMMYLLLAVMTIFVNANSVLAASEKKAVVVASFGTTFHDTLKADIEGVESALKTAFPDRDFYRAFTSNIIRKRLAERDKLIVDDLKTTLEKLAKAGYTDVLVQTTLLTPAEEYNKKLMPVINEYKDKKVFANLVMGKPLLTDEKDFAAVAKALVTVMPKQKEGCSVVFMGHGSPNMYNIAYDKLQYAFDNAKIPAVIGVVEDTDHPNFDDMKRMLVVRNIKTVTLMPLMIVSGDHANNDLVGDEEDSWKSRLVKDGYEVKTQLGGIGRNKAIQAIFVQHAKEALK